MTPARCLTTLSVLLLAAAVRGGDPTPAAEQPVRVTVVVIFASSTCKEVDEKLADLAPAVQKKDAKLTGFKIKDTLQQSVAVGKTYTFKLPDEQTLMVAIDAPKDKNGRVGLTLTADDGSVSYACACGKFFPLLYEQKLKSGERLVVAVAAKPCTGKGP